ncbi:hypothetical protein CAEBREN_25133 [Caenorhabditis brenneri]|uniref:Uncharacterized protein n=1 Tax=Caenorhabditis brenneri TaxID=135651 RepID=G0N5E2_CAEBE|nr:hypothetical protein CAEBREN_25133 [Caenorhabditis brenneri]
MAEHVPLEDITNCPIHNIDEDNNVFSTTTTRPSRTEHRLRMLAKKFESLIKTQLMFLLSLNLIAWNHKMKCTIGVFENIKLE